MKSWFRTLLLMLTIVGIITSIVYLENLKTPGTSITTSSSEKNEIVNPSAFINSEPFKLADFVGKKVVLVDFWTYSCINCQRTLPYVTDWWTKYKDKGLVIVGVHSPEFEFEKDQKNVEAAVKQFGIEYPVVMDNDQSTWDSFGNRFWPHEYLIDLNGNIIYDHIGEGNYDESESEIQKALGLTNMDLSAPENAVSVDFNKVVSAETYFGSDRGTNALSYLIGDWKQKNEYAQNLSTDASVIFEYNAKNVYMVASADAPTEVEVWVDGELIQTITVEANMLYTIVEGADYGSHTLKLVPKKAGLDLFTFTFG